MEATCPRCGGEGRPKSVDRSRYCPSCRRETSRKSVAKAHRERPFRSYARKKNCWNRKNGFDPDMTEEYLKELWTGFCPVAKVPITIDGSRTDPHRANLDRLDPSKGYNRGNVLWLSARMNRLKSNATKEELRSLLEWTEEMA